MSDEELKADSIAPPQGKRGSQKGASSGIRMKVSEKGAVSIYAFSCDPV